MKIELKRFGTLLVSRQNGREALAAFQPQLTTLKINENLELDFDGVLTFSPSWGDEFLTPLLKKYGANLILENIANSSVKTTIEFLEQIHHNKFSKAPTSQNKKN